jgi:hypothetical protein
MSANWQEAQQKAARTAVRVPNTTTLLREGEQSYEEVPAPSPILGETADSEDHPLPWR